MDFNQSYFEIFQIETSYDVDLDKLSVDYRALQMSVHPDKFVSATDYEKRLSVQWAAQVNAAYDTLKSPLQRAIYLLKLNDKEIEHNPKLDPMFLMEQIELREELEALEASGEESLPGLDKFKAQITALLGQLEKSFADQMSQQALEESEQTVYKMQFIHKLLLEANQLEEKLLDY